MSQVLVRSTRILDALAQRSLWSLGELATCVQLPPATCSRLLGSLVELGWADQISPRGAYRLGPRVHALAASRPYEERLISACRQRLTHLTTRLQQPAVLVGMHGSMRQVLLLRNPHSSEAEFLPIKDQNLYQTATGRLLLAHLSQTRRSRLLKQIGLPRPEQWPGVIDRAELLQELRQLRRHGYEEHITNDWHSLAVWIGNWDGHGACIGTFAPPGKLQSDSLEQLQRVQRELLTLAETPRS